MHYHFNESDHAELMTAVMACATEAGGAHIKIDGWNGQSAHLDAGEITVFVAELKKYSEDHPMQHDDTQDLLHGLIVEMDSGRHQTMLVVEQECDEIYWMTIISSDQPFAFDDVIEERDGIRTAIDAFRAKLDEKLTQDSTRLTLAMEQLGRPVTELPLLQISQD